MTTAHEIAALVRQQNWKAGGCLVIDHDDAVALIAQYARVEAAIASRKATEEAFDRAIAIVTGEVPA